MWSPRERPDQQNASIPSLLNTGAPTVSFEFMPPRSERAEAVLWNSVRRLEQLRPTFVSVTYGAGGSTRDRTVRITGRIEQETTLRTVAHLTCVGSSVAQLRSVVGAYAAVGIRNVLALRGDPPGGPSSPWEAHPEGLDHADRLVALVRSLGDFTVGVAAFPDKHPESASLDDDVDTLIRKADAGAAFAITQMVTDVDAYLRLRDRLSRRGCRMPVIPGLLPVTAPGQLQRLTELNGQPLAADVMRRIAEAGDDVDAVRREGIAICTEHSERLLREGAPGLHFMTMNKSTATLEVFATLRELGLV
ncbi:methylenetetrahydrofolate reductase [Flexivirga caeni]|uniref:Methylenetetrahydrofolate reductase n=1 Tax=Flexivirga caeni TaxID=2294115 RepID=A0A3M9MFU6_9MICO|nr:methylenetetrahydrofolate reductase [Flexivirga caeni]RNI24429.1 5,10-methylenetetrahydrofolate reductase [Flexivirga caeni]